MVAADILGASVAISSCRPAGSRTYSQAGCRSGRDRLICAVGPRRAWLPAAAPRVRTVRARSAARQPERIAFEPNLPSRCRPNRRIQGGRPGEDDDGIAEPAFQLHRPNRPRQVLARPSCSWSLRCTARLYAPFHARGLRHHGVGRAPISFVLAIMAARRSGSPACGRLAVGSKRLHDRNKSGWWLMVFWICLSCSLAASATPSPAEPANSTAEILMLASLPIALWGIVESASCAGTKGRTLRTRPAAAGELTPRSFCPSTRPANKSAWPIPSRCFAISSAAAR